jgi:antitoxin component of MazEF toxin-antitoxin module
MAVRLKVWGNQQTMNLPPIILENIKQNAYFRNL